MKRILMPALISLSIFTASAQKLDVAKVPSVVKASFEKKYPAVSGKWEKENGNYEVNFKQKGNSMSVLIDPNGIITETEMDIRANGLPPGALSYIKEHYKGKTIKEGAIITKADGTVNYEAEIAGTDVIFDANGKFIKEAKD